MYDPHIWSWLALECAAAAFIYLELWPGGMTDAAFARRVRWMSRCRGVSRLWLLAIGAAVLGAMVVVGRTHWSYPMRAWAQDVDRALLAAGLICAVLARLTAPRLLRNGRVIALQRDGSRTLSIHMRPAGIRNTFNQTYATRPNHFYLVTRLLTEYQHVLRDLGWHEVEVLSPDVTQKMVGREKFVRHVMAQLPGWRVAFVGGRRMRWLRRMAYRCAQRKQTSDGYERGVILALT